MAKTLKIIPFALAALMLVGCSSDKIGPEKGNNHIVGDDGTTYQEFYDDLYATKGTEFAAKELILRVAKDTVENSKVFSQYGVEKIVKERQNEVLDSFYSTAYKHDGLFDEELLVADLRSKGFKINVPKDSDGNEKPLFKETKEMSSLVKYKGLGTDNLLVADYSDYLTKKADYDIYTQLLKEEYILTEKATYFQTKKIRKIQYFTFTPDNSNKAIEIKEVLESKLDDDKMTFDAFESLGQGLFQDTVTNAAMEKLAKDYAVINNDPKTEDEIKYHDDLYIDLYDGKEHTDTEKTKVKDAWNKYTGNNSYAKETGYFLSKLEINNSLGYHESTISNDDTSSTGIDSTIDTKLFRTTRTTEKESNFLDFTDQGSKVFKSGSNYYTVRYEIIDEETIDARDKAIEEKKSDDEIRALNSKIIEGARALTKNSTNVKNAIAKALEDSGVNIYEESLHTYLKDTYGFDTLKKK